VTAVWRPAGAPVSAEGREGDVEWATAADGQGPVIAGAAIERRDGHSGVSERVVSYAVGADEPAAVRDAVARVRERAAVGFDRVLAEHRARWARRWSDAAISIEGDDEAQLRTRFAIFHLLSAAPMTGEAAVGPRGLTGPAYGGHVLWDADVFVLPALAAIAPPAARAMLEYRLRRLDAARETALAAGRLGARFPWESAADGFDVTPRSGVMPDGRRVPILTGQYEEHVTSDVAWAADRYCEWTGDHAFLTGAGAPLVLETARYWASRAEWDGVGAAHIRDVIGPDEYHERVDDDAFTNVMARWHLRRAARLADRVTGVPAEERRRWLALADALVDGYDATTGVYEQFHGFRDLEPLLITAVARPPIAADVLLGPARVSGAQVVKQPDVLMLHHMVPGEMAPGSLAANLAYYEPRTAQGSSLGPAVHAALLARAGRPDDALVPFRLAAAMDLVDLTGTTAAGLHLATMGGVWQAVVHGFGGVQATNGVLRVDPHLPESWRSITLRCRFQGSPVELRLRPGRADIVCEHPVRVAFGDGRATPLLPPGGTLHDERGGP
jgi:trehalose/maltose hydrolase-like predicted phosphorylase